MKSRTSCLARQAIAQTKPNEPDKPNGILKWRTLEPTEPTEVFYFADTCLIIPCRLLTCLMLQMTSKGFKEDASLSEWSPFYKEIDGKLYKTDQEYALVNYIPDAPRFKKKDEPYRYIAIREPLLEQGLLPDFESVEYPFPVMGMDNRRYKITAIVTNLDWDAQKVINWFRLRCGKCEEAHSIMKSDLAGGRLPSDKFGANAAWWWIMILSLNLNSIMKTLVLDESWVSKRMKAIRFSLINIPGRIINHARRLIIRISGSHPSSSILIRAREAIGLLCPT